MDKNADTNGVSFTFSMPDDYDNAEIISEV